MWGYMNKMEKRANYAFIDSQNLNLAIKDQGWKLDFKRFRKYLEDKYKIAKAFLFIGYIVVFKPTPLVLKDGKIKENVDAELVLHAMIEFSRYEKAVIVTGDWDFHCLIEHLKKQNKLEKLIVPNRHKFSSLLRKFGPDMAFMNELRGKLEYK